jgi:Transposase DDE domain
MLSLQTSKTKRGTTMKDTAFAVDKATVLTAIFVIITEILKEPSAVRALARPGSKPNCPDAEIITVALYQELVGDPREDHFYRMQAKALRGYFPALPSRSRYNRRKRNLSWIILMIRQVILAALGIDHLTSGSIDSAPVPVTGYKRDKAAAWAEVAAYGRCAAKAMKYYGCKLNTLVSETGIVMDFVLSPANHFDNQIVPEFIAQYAHRDVLEEIRGDKAYCDQILQTDLLQEYGVRLKAPLKDNQTIKNRHQDQFVSSKGDNVKRLMVEQVNSQFQEQFHLSKHYAKSVHGLFTRIAAKVTAHTIGMLVNTMLGRKPLALAGLAV